MWPLETDDIEYGLRLRYKFPDVDHATLIKLAACWRRNVDEIETFDPSLRRAVDAGARGTRLTALDLAVAARAAWNARREAERSAETDA